MYCQTCGQQVRDDAVVCGHCGQQLRATTNQNTMVTGTPTDPAGQDAKTNQYQKSKAGVGMLVGVLTLIGNIFTMFINMWLGLALGLGFLLAGLIGGVCKYPKGTVARKTYQKGFGIVAGIIFGLNVLQVVGLFVMVFVLAGMFD